MSKNEKNAGKNKSLKPKSLLLRRVVKDKDKADKKELIIDLASKILVTKEYSDLSMELLSKQAGFAKGTLYSYFQSKEELCLEVLERDYLTWFSDLAEALKKKSIKNPDQLANWVVKSLRNQPRFLRLIPIGASILESNVTEEFILKHKLNLSKQLEQTAQALSAAFPKLDVQHAGLLLVQIHILVIGAWTHGFPNAKVKKVIKEKCLRSLDFDYFDLLSATLKTLLGSLEKE